MRKEIKGVGMTAEEWDYPDTPEEEKAYRRAFREAWKAKGTGFEVVVAPIEEWALYQLEALGFKDRAAYMKKDAPVGDSLGDRAGKYAALVLKYISVTRNAITENNAEEAARFGIRIGESFARIQTTLEWEKFALAGKKHSGEQRRKAALKRGRIDTDGKKISLTEIIGKIAFKPDEYGDPLPSNELWSELFDALDFLHLGPCEEDEEYFFNGGSIKYATFKTMLSNIRNPKKS